MWSCNPAGVLRRDGVGSHSIGEKVAYLATPAARAARSAVSWPHAFPRRKPTHLFMETGGQIRPIDVLTSW